MKQMIVVLVIFGLYYGFGKLFLSPHDNEPVFKIGECVKLATSPEKWSKPGDFDEMSIVVDIGREKYLFKFLAPAILRGQLEDQYFSIANTAYRVVPCPLNVLSK